MRRVYCVVGLLDPMVIALTFRRAMLDQLGVRSSRRVFPSLRSVFSPPKSAP